MTSQRLRGKVMEDIGGEPMVLRIVRRLDRCKEIDEVVVACTDKSTDDPISALMWSRGVRVVRGPEHDVLSRYVLAVKETSAERCVRATADCPYIEPEVTDRVIRSLRPGIDLASNAIGPRTYPKGLDTEVFWADVILRLDRMVTTPAGREHVLWGAYRDDSARWFRSFNVRDSQDNSHVNLCVDTQEDLDFIRMIHSRFGDANYRDIVAGLQEMAA